jgi:hypothetical protein
LEEGNFISWKAFSYIKKAYEFAWEAEDAEKSQKTEIENLFGGHSK